MFLIISSFLMHTHTSPCHPREGEMFFFDLPSFSLEHHNVWLREDRGGKKSTKGGGDVERHAKPGLDKQAVISGRNERRYLC